MGHEEGAARRSSAMVEDPRATMSRRGTIAIMPIPPSTDQPPADEDARRRDVPGIGSTITRSAPSPSVDSPSFDSIAAAERGSSCSAAGASRFHGPLIQASATAELRPLARVLVADPPWAFGDRLPGKSRGAEKNYLVMSVDALERMELPPILSSSVLFLWRVAAMQEEALRVARAWGFVVKSELVWRKLTVNGLPHFGMGRYVRASHEVCLIGVRGRCFPRDRSTRSVFEASYTRHSGKPDEFYALVERLYEGPYVELFARRQRPGWTCLGNEMPA